MSIYIYLNAKSAPTSHRLQNMYDAHTHTYKYIQTYIRYISIDTSLYRDTEGASTLYVTETPSVSPRPLSGIHIPLSGAPVSAHGRAACHPSHACAFR